MKTIEYIEACKQKLGIESDYKLAQALEITRSAMSAYRNSGVTFSRHTAKKVAKILGIHPLRVVADMERQRAKTPEEQAMWRDFAGKLAAIALGAVGLAAIATYPADGVAAAQVAQLAFMLNQRSTEVG